MNGFDALGLGDGDDPGGQGGSTGIVGGTALRRGLGFGLITVSLRWLMDRTYGQRSLASDAPHFESA